MSEGQDGQSSSYVQLQSKKSLAEILAMAIEFERSARDFYTGLIPRVSKQIRYLVEELAEEEQRHFDLFSELRARPDLEDQIQEMVEIERRYGGQGHIKDLVSRGVKALHKSSDSGCFAGTRLTGNQHQAFANAHVLEAMVEFRKARSFEEIRMSDVLAEWHTGEAVIGFNHDPSSSSS